MPPKFNSGQSSQAHGDKFRVRDQEFKEKRDESKQSSIGPRADGPMRKVGENQKFEAVQPMRKDNIEPMNNGNREVINGNVINSSLKDAKGARTNNEMAENGRTNHAKSKTNYVTDKIRHGGNQKVPVD